MSELNQIDINMAQDPPSISVFFCQEKESREWWSSQITSFLVSWLSRGICLSKHEQPPFCAAQCSPGPCTLDVSNLYLDKCFGVWMFDLVCAISKSAEHKNVESLLCGGHDSSSRIPITLAHRHRWNVWYGLDSFRLLPVASCDPMRSYLAGFSLQSWLYCLDHLPRQYRRDGFWRDFCITVCDPLDRIDNVCCNCRLQFCPSFSADPESGATSSRL